MLQEVGKFLSCLQIWGFTLLFFCRWVSTFYLVGWWFIIILSSLIIETSEITIFAGEVASTILFLNIFCSNEETIEPTYSHFWSPDPVTFRELLIIQSQINHYTFFGQLSMIKISWGPGQHSIKGLFYAIVYFTLSAVSVMLCQSHLWNIASQYSGILLRAEAWHACFHALNSLFPFTQYSTEVNSLGTLVTLVMQKILVMIFLSRSVCWCGPVASVKLILCHLLRHNSIVNCHTTTWIILFSLLKQHCLGSNNSMNDIGETSSQQVVEQHLTLCTDIF